MAKRLQGAGGSTVKATFSFVCKLAFMPTTTKEIYHGISEF
jgi:hypothetical protein